jgi:excisionase family DNA binding protein
MTTNQRRLTVTVEEAGALLGVGRSTAYELVRSGEIPSIRLRRRIVVPIARFAAVLGTSPEGLVAMLEPQLAGETRPSKDREVVGEGEAGRLF